jgi:hypothetical protein
MRLAQPKQITPSLPYAISIFEAAERWQLDDDGIEREGEFT